MQGKVKWFDAQKYYGFVAGDDEQDYFLHGSDWIPDWPPKENELIKFEVDVDREGRPHAVKAERLED